MQNTLNWGEQRIVLVTETPTEGSFAKHLKTDENICLVDKWIPCREEFQTAKITCFFFAVKPKKGKSVAYFIDAVESKLSLSNRSLFGPTQRDDIIWVEASSWWMRSAMRRSLFTALIRAGTQFKPRKNNFQEALFSIDYTKNTKYAVQRFLRGHTKYTGRIRGWYQQFYFGRRYIQTESQRDETPTPPSQAEIRKLLI